MYANDKHRDGENVENSSPTSRSDHKNSRETPGPDPERVKIDVGKWEDAVRKALQKKNPPGGFPPRGPGRQRRQAMGDDT